MFLCPGHGTSGYNPGHQSTHRYIQREGETHANPVTHRGISRYHVLLRVLTALRKGNFSVRLPKVVVFTISAQLHDIDVCYQLGANSYVVKPVDLERLRHARELLMRYWFSVVTLPKRRSPC